MQKKGILRHLWLGVSAYRYSPLSVPDVFSVLGELNEVPDVLCKGGWWPSDARMSEQHVLAGYAINQGVSDGINPIREARIPRKATVPAETHAASPDEVLAIMDVLEKAGKQKARAAVALMFFAGLRPGEARGVCWEDFDGKQLFVRQSVWRTFRTEPKTADSAKPVPVIEPLRSILVELRAREGNPVYGPILRGPKGRPLNLDNLARREVVPTLTRCGICKQLRSDHREADHDYQLDESLPTWHGWYSLRRGIATTLQSVEKDPMAAKGLLRHSSVLTTQRHYIKEVPETTLNAMKKVEALCNVCATDADAIPS